MPVRRSLIALVISLGVVLGGCATEPTVPTPDFQALLTDVSGANDVFGVGTLLIDVSSLGPVSTAGSVLAADTEAQLAPADFVDAGNGLLFGDLVEAADGDTVDLVLPTVETIPAAALSPVEEAFVNATETPDCDVAATPSTASVTGVAFEGFAFPGFFGFGVDGLLATVASEMSLDLGGTFPDEGDTVLSWAYADSAVVVDFVGLGCDLVVQNVALAEGWNTLQWTFTNVADPTDTITLSVIDQPDAFNLFIATP